MSGSIFFFMRRCAHALGNSSAVLRRLGRVTEANLSQYARHRLGHEIVHCKGCDRLRGRFLKPIRIPSPLPTASNLANNEAGEHCLCHLEASLVQTDTPQPTHVLFHFEHPFVYNRRMLDPSKRRGYGWIGAGWISAGDHLDPRVTD